MRINSLFLLVAYSQHQKPHSQMKMNQNKRRRKLCLEEVRSYVLLSTQPTDAEVGMDCPAFRYDAALFVYFRDVVGGFGFDASFE